jgi:thiol-disulfide isomerase/thioredoxin
MRALSEGKAALIFQKGTDVDMRPMGTERIGKKLYASLALILLAVLVLGSVQALAQTYDVKPIDVKGVKSLVDKNKGKVLLLNFWATWCPPCLEEFPALVKIHSNYKAKGVEMIGISMNDQEEMDDLQAFLRKQKVPFPIYIAGTVEDEFYTAIDKRWTSEIPLTMIYDKTGKLRYFHNDARTYEQFEKDLQSLLGSK